MSRTYNKNPGRMPVKRRSKRRTSLERYKAKHVPIEPTAAYCWQRKDKTPCHRKMVRTVYRNSKSGHVTIAWRCVACPRSVAMMPKQTKRIEGQLPKPKPKPEYEACFVNGVWREDYRIRAKGCCLKCCHGLEINKATNQARCARCRWYTKAQTSLRPVTTPLPREDRNVKGVTCCVTCCGGMYMKGRQRGGLFCPSCCFEVAPQPKARWYIDNLSPELARLAERKTKPAELAPQTEEYRAYCFALVGQDKKTRCMARLRQERTNTKYVSLFCPKCRHSISATPVRPFNPNAKTRRATIKVVPEDVTMTVTRAVNAMMRSNYLYDGEREEIIGNMLLNIYQGKLLVEDVNAQKANEYRRKERREYDPRRFTSFDAPIGEDGWTLLDVLDDAGNILRPASKRNAKVA